LTPASTLISVPKSVSNNFHGHIPSQIDHFNIPLNSNKLHGHIPSQIDHFNIPLNSNKLHGYIPSQIDHFNIPLNSNKLHGHIPSQINRFNIPPNSIHSAQTFYPNSLPQSPNYQQQSQIPSNPNTPILNFYQTSHIKPSEHLQVQEVNDEVQNNNEALENEEIASESIIEENNPIEAPKASNAPRAPKASNTARAPKASNAPRASKAANAPRAPTAANTPEVQEESSESSEAFEHYEIALPSSVHTSKKVECTSPHGSASAGSASASASASSGSSSASASAAASSPYMTYPGVPLQHNQQYHNQISPCKSSDGASPCEVHYQRNASVNQDGTIQVNSKNVGEAQSPCQNSPCAQ
ncbi:hypothetical protein PV327_011185, partial [Microctonus hyperodae]